MNAVCKRRENRGGEVESCLYTQMRLLESGWLEIEHDQFHHLGRGGAAFKICRGGLQWFSCPFKVFGSKANLVPFPLQNTRGIITDLGVTTTSSPTALHLHRLSLQLSPPTCLAQDLEAWRDQATTLRRTRGSRT